MCEYKYDPAKDIQNLIEKKKKEIQFGALNALGLWNSGPQETQEGWQPRDEMQIKLTVPLLSLLTPHWAQGPGGS